MHYLRTKEGKELDFLVSIAGQPTHLLEAKWSDGDPAPAFKHFQVFFPRAKSIQLVKDLKRETTFPSGLEIRALLPWLQELPLL